MDTAEQPVANGSKGSQIAAIIGIFEGFWGQDQPTEAEEWLAEECEQPVPLKPIPLPNMPLPTSVGRAGVSASSR